MLTFLNISSKSRIAIAVKRVFKCPASYNPLPRKSMILAGYNKPNVFSILFQVRTDPQTYWTAQVSNQLFTVPEGMVPVLLQRKWDKENSVWMDLANKRFPLVTAQNNEPKRLSNIEPTLVKIKPLTSDQTYKDVIYSFQLLQCWSEAMRSNTCLPISYSTVPNWPRGQLPLLVRKGILVQCKISLQDRESVQKRSWFCTLFYVFGELSTSYWRPECGKNVRRPEPP